MKRAHEVTVERWTMFTPQEIAQAVADMAKKFIGVGIPQTSMKGTRRLRITIRVEIVEEPKEDKCTS